MKYAYAMNEYVSYIVAFLPQLWSTVAKIIPLAMIGTLIGFSIYIMQAALKGLEAGRGSFGDDFEPCYCNDPGMGGTPHRMH